MVARCGSREDVGSTMHAVSHHPRATIKVPLLYTKASVKPAEGKLPTKLIRKEAHVTYHPTRNVIRQQSLSGRRR